MRTLVRARAPVLLMALLVNVAVAQPWTITIQGSPGLALLGLCSATNEDGRIVLASSEGIGNKDVVLFQINAQGQLIWSWQDSVKYYAPFDQTPLLVAALPNNCWAVLAEERIPVYPIVRGRLLWLMWDSSGTLQQTTVVCDTLSGARLDPSMVINHDCALVVWRDTRPTAGIWYQRIRLSDGQILEGQFGQFLNAGYAAAVSCLGDSCLVAAADSTYLFGPDGLIKNAWGGAYLHRLNILVRQDNWFVYGYQAASQSLLLQRFSLFGWQSTDTISYGQQLPVELVMANCQDTLFLGYARAQGLYLRRYNNNWLSSEDTLSYQQGVPCCLHLQSFDSGTVVAVWANLDQGHEVYLQQWRHGSWRWSSGLVIGSMSLISPQPPLTLSGNGQVVVVAWINQGIITVQPPDTMTSAVPDHPATVTSFAFVQVYPNPTNGMVRVRYGLDQATQMSLTVHNLLGQRVATIIDNSFVLAGTHQVIWRPGYVASGMYLITLSSPSSPIMAWQKVVYLK